MLRITSMSKLQACIWLRRNDPEYKTGWLAFFNLGENLREAVYENIRDFGSINEFYGKKF